MMAVEFKGDLGYLNEAGEVEYYPTKCAMTGATLENGTRCWVTGTRYFYWVARDRDAVPVKAQLDEQALKLIPRSRPEPKSEVNAESKEK